MNLNKSQKIIIGVIVLLLLTAVVFIVWNSNKTPVSQCPQWINCMPGPGRTGECKVPRGCEGITKIAQ